MDKVFVHGLILRGRLSVGGVPGVPENGFHEREREEGGGCRLPPWSDAHAYACLSICD